MTGCDDATEASASGFNAASPQWEYKVGWVSVENGWDDIAAEAKNVEDILNSKYGANGWEFVGVLSMAISQNTARSAGLHLWRISAPRDKRER